MVEGYAVGYQPVSVEVLNLISSGKNQCNIKR
jgi:hypothetical protein